jgi:hypothetical protein
MLSEVKTGHFSLPLKAQKWIKHGKLVKIKLYQYSNPPTIIKDRENKIIDKKGFIEDVKNYTFLSILAEEDRDMFINELSEEEMISIWRRQGIDLNLYFKILKRCILNNNYHFHRMGYKGESNTCVEYPLKSSEPVYMYTMESRTKIMSFPFLPSFLSSYFSSNDIYVLMHNNKMEIIENKNYVMGCSMFDLKNDYYA